MQKAEKVVVTCAVTGAIHTPTMSNYLPITPEQIASDAIAAADAGASVLHLHARDPATGRPTPDANIFKQFLPKIKDSCDAIINITTGGATIMSLEERLEAPHMAQPELCSLNMGTMNFGTFPAIAKFKDWKYDWEASFLDASRKLAFSNSFEQIERIIREVGHAYGTRFEFECYDVGHLYTLNYYADQKLIEPPFFIQCIFGILGGIGADAENLTHMRAIADKLFGNDYYMSVLGAGRHQMGLVTMSALMGGNVRVGLEDSLYIAKGELAHGNADQVSKIVRILGELSLDVASPDEAREMLHLKGQDNVAF